MIDDGKCRQSCRMYPGSMDENELAILKNRKLGYYKKEALRILLELIPVQKPFVPIIEAIGI